jgi:hypothetical protein
MMDKQRSMPRVGRSSSSGTAETVTAPSCAFITGIQDNPGMPKEVDQDRYRAAA